MLEMSRKTNRVLKTLTDRRIVMLWMCKATKTENVEEPHSKALGQLPTVLTVRLRRITQHRPTSWVSISLEYSRQYDVIRAHQMR